MNTLDQCPRFPYFLRYPCEAFDIKYNLKILSVNLSAVITASLLMLGMLGALITLNIPSTLAQPCNNNAHGVLGSGKQIFKQSNRCVIVENNNPASVICATNSTLENGVCVPITSNGICGTNAVLQNGVCVPTTTNGVCGANSVLQNGVCVPTTNSTRSTP